MLYNKESIKVKNNKPNTAHIEHTSKIQESTAKAAQISASTGRNSTPNLAVLTTAETAPERLCSLSGPLVSPFQRTRLPRRTSLHSTQTAQLF